MANLRARNVSWGIAIIALGLGRPLPAQLEIGNWTRQQTPSMPSMTLTIQACCGEGRRLTYHVVMKEMAADLVVESRLDGTDAPVLMAGKPSGETMAIKRLDAHHASAVLKMNGNVFATSQATLSADGKTLTVLSDYSAQVGANPVGKVTETWVKQ